MTTEGAADGARAERLIGRVTAEQWEVYRQVRLAALAEAPYAFSSTLDRERELGEPRWRERIERGATFLAWQEGEPVGTATGLAYDPSDGHDFPGAWQLVGMWVDPRARGLGVADGLIEAVAEEARTAEAPALVLWVTEVNGRARAFYARAGFRGTGARALVRPDEPDHWEELMIRELG